MKKIFGIIAVTLLIIGLTFTVGCDKKDLVYEGATDGNVSGLPENAVTAETDSEGNTVIIEDTVTDDELEHPEKYNNASSDSSKTQSTTTSTQSNTSTQSGTQSTSSQTASSNASSVDENTSSTLDGTQETNNSGYSQGWIN